MAVLSAFRTDSTKIRLGDWVSPGPEFDDLEICVRGYSDAYADERAKRFRIAHSKLKGEEMSASAQRDIVVGLLCDMIVMDVRGLAHADGTPIGVDEFKELLRDPDYADLVTAVQKAAAKVGVVKQTTAGDAVKN